MRRRKRLYNLNIKDLSRQADTTILDDISYYISYTNISFKTRSNYNKKFKAYVYRSNYMIVNNRSIKPSRKCTGISMIEKFSDMLRENSLIKFKDITNDMDDEDFARSSHGLKYNSKFRKVFFDKF